MSKIDLPASIDEKEIACPYINIFLMNKERAQKNEERMGLEKEIRALIHRFFFNQISDR